MDAEKAASTMVDGPPNNAIYHADGELLVNVNTSVQDSLHLKLAQDNKTVLIPQPSEDVLDPLNWPWWRKHALLLVLCTASVLPEFAVASGPSCVNVQGAEWNITSTHANYANNLAVLFFGIGGPLTVPFLTFWGRAPTIFWWDFITAMLTLGAALAQTFNEFYALKALQGLFMGGGQMASLSVLHDIFFFHEEARKIGIWTASFTVAPYLGPMFANYVLAETGSWRNVYWMTFGLACLNLVLQLLFLDETFYRRDISPENQPDRGNRLMRILGVWQIRNHSKYFSTAALASRRVWLVFWKPIIIPVMLYYMSSFMWAVGINQTSSILFATPREAGGYGFGPLALGYSYWGPVIGVAVGEIFGHFFNDFIAFRYISKHEGTFIPEARLPPLYLAGSFMTAGLVLVGQALQNHLTWVAIVFGWGIFVVGTMVSTALIATYAMDSYPNAAGEVNAFVNLARLLGGFCVGYFQLQWGLGDGFDVSFGVQAAVAAGGTLLVIPALQIWGKKLRHKGGPVKDSAYHH